MAKKVYAFNSAKMRAVDHHRTAVAVIIIIIVVVFDVIFVVLVHIIYVYFLTLKSILTMFLFFSHVYTSVNNFLFISFAPI